MRMYGSALIREILRAVAVSFPQRILRSLASLLHSVLNHRLFGQAAGASFAESMASDEVLGKHSASMSDDGTTLNAQAVLKQLKIGSWCGWCGQNKGMFR